MLPDYPHKIFNDKRGNYSLLMETLAMDARQQRAMSRELPVLLDAQS
jgi:hypothetical protein